MTCCRHSGCSRGVTGAHCVSSCRPSHHHFGLLGKVWSFMTWLDAMYAMGINPSGKIHIQTYFQLLPLECFVLLFQDYLLQTAIRKRTSFPAQSILGYCQCRNRWLNIKEGTDQAGYMSAFAICCHVNQERRDTEQRPGILAVRPEGPLFYANIERLEDWKRSILLEDWDRCFVSYDFYEVCLYLIMQCHEAWNILKYIIYLKISCGYPYNIDIM